MAAIENRIKMRDTEKQARIEFKSGDLKFQDPQVKSLLGLVPLAYEKMAKMPYVYQSEDSSKPTRMQIKKQINKVEKLMEKLSAV